MSVEVERAARAFPPVAPNAPQLPYVVRQAVGTAARRAAPLWVLLAALLALALALAHGGDGLAGLITLALVAAAAGLWLRRARMPVLTLHPDRIEVHGVFGPRILARRDIAGVTRTRDGRAGSCFTVVAKPGRGDGVRLAAALRDDPVVADWLAGAPDPQQAAVAADRARVLADARYGASADERAARLKATRVLVMVYSVGCLGAAAWILFFAPLDASMLVAALAAWATAAVLAAGSGGLIVWTFVGRARPSIVAGFAPAAAVIVRGLGVHMLQAGPLIWSATGAGAAAAGALALRPSRYGTRLRNATVAGLAGGLALYGAGAALDAGLDAAPPQAFAATVTGKHVSYGRATTYRLALAPWGPDGAGRVTVPRSLYERVRVGASVCPVRHPGALGLAWFQVAACGARVG